MSSLLLRGNWRSTRNVPADICSKQELTRAETIDCEHDS